MAAYSADILLNVKYNQRSLERVAATVGKVQALAKQVKPINLLSPGAGAGADQIQVAMEKILNRAKAINKEGSSQISATYAGAAQTAESFAEVLRNVSINAVKGTVSLERQDETVRALAGAYALAETKAENLAERYEQLITLARQQAGLAIGPASRLGTAEADSAAAAARQEAAAQAQASKNLRSDLTFQRLKLNLILNQNDALLKQTSLAARLAKKAAEFGGAGQFAENLALGVGFPLLFGGGPGSVGGSAVGSFFGKGFGGQILGGALGAKLDEAVNRAIALGNAVRDVDLDKLQELGIAITGNLRTQVELYRQIGDEVAAQQLITQQVVLQTGVFAESQQDIANAGNQLSSAWGNFTAILSNTIGLIGLPFAAALSTILRIVNGLLQTVNFIVSGIGLGIKRAAEWAIELVAGGEALENMNAWITLFNGKLDESVLKARELFSEINSRILDTDLELKFLKQQRTGDTASDKVANALLERDLELEKQNNDLVNKRIEARKTLAKAGADQLKTALDLLQTEHDKNVELINQRATLKVNRIEQQEAAKQAREAANEAEKLSKELERSYKAGVALQKALHEQLSILSAETDFERELLKVQFDYVKNQDKINELLDEGQKALLSQYNLDLLQVATAKVYTEELKKQNEEYYKRAGLQPQDAFREAPAPVDVGLAFGGQDLFGVTEDKRLVEAKQRLSELVDPINQVKFAAEGIGSAFTSSFTEVINGSMTAQEALASFFSKIADAFMDMAAQIITRLLIIKALESAISIFGSSSLGNASAGFGAKAFSGAGIGSAGFSIPGLIPGKAVGGSVSSGKPYMVGERGPELFVPGRSGTIVPNNKLGGGGSANVVVNVDATGSRVEGDSQQAKQLGDAIGVAIRQELIKQKRPGGLLS